MIIYLLPFIAFWFARVSGIPQGFRNVFKLNRFKPFDCSKCMGFWLGLIYQFTDWQGIDSLLVACFISLVAYVTEFVAEYKIKMLLH